MTAGKEKKIRVLFITKWYPNQDDPQLGIFIRKHAMAAALFADVSLLFISPFYSSMQPTDFYISEDNNVRQYYLYYRKSSLRLISLLRYYNAFRKGWKAVMKNSGRPDIIHANLLTRPALMAWMLSVRNGIPYILTEHWTGFVNNKFGEKPVWYRWLTRRAASGAAAVTVVSEHLKAALKSKGIAKNIIIVPNVVDTPETISARRNSNDKILFATVADLLDEQKNVSGTIRAVATILLKRKDFEFHIIGGGPDEEMLRSLAAGLGLLNTFVIFHGRQDNDFVYDFLSRIDFIVVNSNAETFSVVTAEAMACGRPVIGTVSGGPEEIITPETGMLIEKGNQQQLTASIEEMLDRCRSYDADVLKNSVSRFSREETGKAFYRIYSEVLRRKQDI